jgi:hypothetical protein
VAALGLVSLCGMAAGQLCGPCGGVPVAIAGPGLSIASSNGVTACAGLTGATAIADGVVASAGPGCAIAGACGGTTGPDVFGQAPYAGIMHYAPYDIPGQYII